MSVITALKRCSACGDEFPATPEFFNRHRRDKDGLYSACKKCSREQYSRSIQNKAKGYRRCPHCGEEKPLTQEFFSPHSSKKDGFHHWCKKCNAKAARERSYRDKAGLNGHSHPIVIQPVGTPDQCGSCGTTQGNIFGDVNEATFEKYGYLCMKCHRLVRDFQGDSERIRNVLKYVEQTRLGKRMPATVTT